MEKSLGTAGLIDCVRRLRRVNNNKNSAISTPVVFIQFITLPLRNRDLTSKPIALFSITLSWTAYFCCGFKYLRLNSTSVNIESNFFFLFFFFNTWRDCFCFIVKYFKTIIKSSTYNKQSDENNSIKTICVNVIKSWCFQKI